MRLSKGWLAIIVCFLVIIIDQVIKIWVKTSFYWGEDVELLPWMHLRFIQNNGMAFGMEFGSKLFLSVFRIIAVIALSYYMYILVRSKTVKTGYLLCIALITAGAAGNIIDCLFYGMIFTNPLPPECAHFVPWGEGYAGMFHGMVVDMFYFPLFQWTWPDWLPMLGGREFTFFDPVFNFADASISVGIFLLIVCYYKYLGNGPMTKGNVECQEKDK